MRRLVLWVAGFVVLLAVNAVVELFLLPYWGLDNSPRNDIYFRGWWAIVAAWLLFGNLILIKIEGHHDSVSQGSTGRDSD